MAAGCEDAPVFRPTAEEFADPLGYIQSIRAVGEAAGIVKIIPPADWNPPFALSIKRFKFSTRAQLLNVLQADVRAGTVFLDRLRRLLFGKGITWLPFRMPTPKGAPATFLPVLQLYRVVKSFGGARAVADWTSVAYALCGPAAVAASPGLGRDLAAYYAQMVLPMEDWEREHPTETEHKTASAGGGGGGGYRSRGWEAADMLDAAKQAKRAHDAHVNARTPPRTSLPLDPGVIARYQFEAELSGKPVSPGALEVKVGDALWVNVPDEGTHRATVVELGGSADPNEAQHTLMYPTGHQESFTTSELNIVVANGATAKSAKEAHDQDLCQRCLRPDRAAQLLLCDACDCAYHIFCLTPRLKAVPSGDWFCPACCENVQFSKYDRFGYEEGPSYALPDFIKFANDWKAEYFQSGTTAVPLQQVEAEYWRILGHPAEVPAPRVVVNYGNDIDTARFGSGFPKAEYASAVPLARNIVGTPEFQHYASNGWNINNLPNLRGSLLQYVGSGITGVNQPWLYMGMCFTSFAWHTEDHYFYSINYHHFGEPKVWYGCPGAQADAVEAVVRDLAPELFESQHDIMTQLVTMIPPAALIARGIRVVRAVQEPKQFIITFPKAYHAGFNAGFNCAEAVNFAVADWFPFGEQAQIDYRRLGRLPVLPFEALVHSICLAIAATPPAESALTAAHVYPVLDRLLQQLEGQLNEARELGAGLLEGVPAGFDTTVGTEDRRRRRRPTTIKVTAVRGKAARMLDRGRARKYEVSQHQTVPRCATCMQYCYFVAVVCTCADCGDEKPLTVSCWQHQQQLCASDVSERLLFCRVPIGELQRLRTVAHKVVQAKATWELEVHALVTEHAPVPTVTQRRAKQLLDEAHTLGLRDAAIPALKAMFAKTQAWVDKAGSTLPKPRGSARNKAATMPTVADLEALVQSADELPLIPEQAVTAQTVLSSVRSVQHLAQTVLGWLGRGAGDGSELHKTWLSKRRVEPATADRWLAQHVISQVEELGYDIPELATLREYARGCDWLLTMDALYKETGQGRPTLAEAVLVMDECPEAMSNTKEAKNLRTDIRELQLFEDTVMATLAAAPQPQDITDLLNRYGDMPFRSERVDAEDLPALGERIQNFLTKISAIEASGVRPPMAELEALLQDQPKAVMRSPQYAAWEGVADTCRKWKASCTHCFVTISGAKAGDTLTSVLTHGLAVLNALDGDRAEFDKLTSTGDTGLYCVCQQPYREGVLMVACSKCPNWYHPQCVGIPPNMASSIPDYVCEKCSIAAGLKYLYRRPGGRIALLFCVCRQSADAVPGTMICCNNCSIWYHVTCVGLNDDLAASLEQYECEACCRKACKHYQWAEASNPTSKNELHAAGQQPNLHSVQALVNSAKRLKAEPAELGPLLQLVDRVIKWRDNAQRRIGEAVDAGRPDDATKILGEAKLLEILVWTPHAISEFNARIRAARSKQTVAAGGSPVGAAAGNGSQSAAASSTASTGSSSAAASSDDLLAGEGAPSLVSPTNPMAPVAGASGGGGGGGGGGGDDVQDASTSA